MNKAFDGNASERSSIVKSRIMKFSLCHGKSVCTYISGSRCAWGQKTINTHIRTYTHSLIRTHPHIHLSIHTHTHTQPPTHPPTHTCTHSRPLTHTGTHKHTHTHKNKHTRDNYCNLHCTCMSRVNEPICKYVYNNHCRF